MMSMWAIYINRTRARGERQGNAEREGNEDLKRKKRRTCSTMITGQAALSL